ncbi:DUF262 domain-containing protein [Flavobacterium ponti]|uniref:DUF262 domain-containing protein n=1 Tax=Flavobacterium ponti TaxID=665133 RepID=A0ABV9P051_9FLAO
MENILDLKTVNDLQEFRFLIPSYQRGYRWSSNQIKDLLNDIYEFKPKEVQNSDNKTWYCLQPVVVKKIDDTYFEVIDGQQRLTSIYIILFYLNQQYADDFKQKLFKLEYETRKDSETFLVELNNTTNHNNIDYFYISEAYKTVREWFLEKGNSFNRNEFESNFKFNTRVIWYESTEEDSVAIFTRINIGKIPLTNSELIKALFLNSSNFIDKNEKLRLRQLEIASEWDNIEQTLQKDKIWYFLTENKKSTNRIEFIFELMNDENDGNDLYSTFRFFQKKLKNKNEKLINEFWLQIKRRYQIFCEWYEERELYHKIGYLICVGFTDIKTLYEYNNSMTKSEFKLKLDELIKSSVKNIKLNELQYDDKDDVKRILLLYNIVTMLKTTKDNSYFPFDSFKKDNWDIEHITSVKSEMPDKGREEWLKDAKIFIDPEIDKKDKLKNKIDNFNDFKDNDLFKEIYDEIILHFNSNLKDSDVNDISNLTLLDSSTNRGYKNAVFPIKRKTIINRDKEGVFIPLCTKNVFLKYFSEYPPKISFWTEEDRENYEKDLEKTLSEFLN